MQNSKTLTYLRTLSKRETSKFDEFINSTYHNKSKLLIELWKYLKAFSPKFKHDKLEKDLLIVHLYSTVNQNTTKRFNDLTVAFCKLFEQFLLLQNLNKNQNYQERLLINELGERRISKAFYKRIEKNKKQIGKKAIQDIQDYEQLLFLETERYFYPETSKYNVEDEGMQLVLDTIHDYSKLLKLKNIAEAKQIEMFVNRTFFIEKQSNNINPLFQIYELIIELATNENNNWEGINKLNILFNRNLDSINNREEKQGILNFLINYASIHYTKDVRYYEVLFENLKLGMESKLLIEKEVLHESYFVNTCIVACELQHTNWLIFFIENYLQFIEADKIQNMKNIGTLNLLFAEKKYAEVISLITAIDITIGTWEYWYKIIEIRAFYEIFTLDYKYYESVEHKLIAFKRYCYRKKDLSEIRIRSYLNFIKNIKILITWNTLSKIDKSKFHSEISKEATICKLWLLEKIV